MRRVPLYVFVVFSAWPPSPHDDGPPDVQVIAVDILPLESQDLRLPKTQPDGQHDRQLVRRSPAAPEDLPEIFLGRDLDLVADLLRQRGIELQRWEVGVQDSGKQAVGVLDGFWRLFFGQAIDPALHPLLGQILELYALDVPHVVFADLL